MNSILKAVSVKKHRDQHHFLWLVIATYILAGLVPHPGLLARQCLIPVLGEIRLSLPMLMLALLLFNSGFAATLSQPGTVWKSSWPVVAGVLVNLVIPLVFLIGLRFVLLAWPDAQEANCLLLGLAVVAAMPVAGSSTAWSQNCNGNVALSLGLVLLSTFLSPFTTPIVLASIGGLSAGAPADALQRMSGQGTGGFLLACVAIPSALGLLARRIIGEKRGASVKSCLKPLSTLVLLFLCYGNATVALPQVMANPDWDYFALVLLAVVGLCCTAFASGWLLSRWLGVDPHDQRALVFGLGMSNNGTGLVLAASALDTLHWAVVPVLAYNLVQHLVAGGISCWMARTPEPNDLSPKIPAC